MPETGQANTVEVVSVSSDKARPKKSGPRSAAPKHDVASTAPVAAEREHSALEDVDNIVTTGTVLKWAAIGVLSGLVTVGAASALSGASPEPSTATTKVAAPVAVAPPAAVAPAVAEQPAAEAEETASAEETAPAEETAANASTPSAEETASLDRAKKAAASGLSAKALIELDRHDKEFPGAALAHDSAATRIQALLAKGDRKNAKRLATQFLAANADSDQADRVKKLLARASRPAVMHASPAAAPAPQPVAEPVPRPVPQQKARFGDVPAPGAPPPAAAFPPAQ